MHLTAEQIQHYRDKGYVAGPRVLHDDQIERLKARIADILEGRVVFPENLMGREVLKSDRSTHRVSVKIVNLFRHDDVFAEVVRNPMIGCLAHDLLEGPVRMWTDQMIFKPADDDQAKQAWHRDYTYWNQVGPPEMGTCWIALDDAMVSNGCMHVVPGSHKWNYDYHRDDVDDSDPHWPLLPQNVPDGADTTAVPCEVKTGHCHFHHCKLLHGSYGSKTDNPRRAYVMHLMPGSTRRLGDNWNDRLAPLEMPIGEIVQGPLYPELVTPASV